jgi:dienelactone hydrolase
MRLSVSLLLMVSVVISAYADIKGEPVEYTAGDVVLKGYLAYDDGMKDKRPGVLVVHEWWGHNEYARKRARMLATLGYTALAVDMYGDGKQAAHPDDAGKFAGEVMQNMETAKARFMAAMDVLKKHKTVDPKHIAAIGYCFGGGVVLQMARLGLDIDGVASFHGSLSTSQPAQPGAIKAKILVCHGADDPFIPQQQVDQFQEEMKKAKADFQFISYPGATHSFTNPDADAYGKQFGMPIAYNAKADGQSWEDMQKFFKTIFESK